MFAVFSDKVPAVVPAPSYSFQEVTQRMNEKSTFSGVTKLLFISPYFLLVFLVIPVYIVLGLKLGLPVSGDLLLVNNIIFCVCIILRLVWRVLKMSRGDIRYGADSRPPKSELELDRPASQLQTELAGAGFIFAAGGRYGEKRDIGYLGATVLYGGLLLLLFFGSYDYMREYSVMGRLGVGEPMPLNPTGLIGPYEAGFFARYDKMPLVQVRKQILPNPQWPKGATEIVLLSEDRKELTKTTIAPGKSFSYGGLDYSMTRFIFDALIVISGGNSIAYEGFVKFYPLPVKKGEYSYYGGIINKTSEKFRGAAWLNPADKKKVRVEATLDGKKIVETELELWGESKKTQGDYTAKLEGLAQWSEIRVARSRHSLLLMIGAALAVLGGFMRIAVRPQRVWLEESEKGCRVKATGGKALQLLQG